MSQILKKIKEDLKIAMKKEITFRNSDSLWDDKFNDIIAQKETSRAIISMFPDIGVKPNDATDDDTIKLIKRYINMEKTRELYVQKFLTEKDVEGLSAKELNNLIFTRCEELGDSLTSSRIDIAKSYLPKALTEEELISWIKENVDFSQFKNKMQAMKIIMSEFKGMDGNFVKKVLLENF